MKNFLSLKRSLSLQNRNITKQTRDSYPYPEGCGSGSGALCQILPGGQQFDTTKIAKDECFCVDSSSYASFVFGKGLTIEGTDRNGESIGKKTNAWGGSTGYFKVTATVDTEVTYLANYIQVFTDMPENYDARQIAVLKDWDGKISYEADFSDENNVPQTYEMIYTGALEVKVSYETGDENRVESQFLPDPERKLNEQKDEVTATFGYLQVYPNVDEPEAKKYTADASVTVTLTKKPSYYPEKIFQIKPNMIFDDSLEEYEFLDSGGLSGGAIAGIVIACVVVVGVVVFCVVWFVVLKKPCCCGKGGKNSDAEA